MKMYGSTSCYSNLVKAIDHAEDQSIRLSLEPELKVLLHKTIEALKQEPPALIYAENRVMLLIEKVFFTVKAMLERPAGAQKQEPETLAQLSLIARHLEENIQQDAPSINQLARMAAMSPTKLKKDFKAIYGLPVYKYYRNRKMKFIEGQISDNNLTVKDAALLAGYSNTSHFIKAFINETGKRPEALTQKNNIDEQS
jgi:AraC-like DNA-binding protein